MNLYVLAYNLKRMVCILGVGPLLKAIRALSLISQIPSLGSS